MLASRSLARSPTQPPSLPHPPTHPPTYSYYGHDEADFGIAYMFGGLDSSFYEA